MFLIFSTNNSGRQNSLWRHRNCKYYCKQHHHGIHQYNYISPLGLSRYTSRLDKAKVMVSGCLKESG